MRAIGTPPDPSTAEEFAHAHSQLIEELRARTAQTALGGSERSRQKHLDRGKLLPRDRVERLLDPGSPFLEFSALAANGMYNDDSPGAASSPEWAWLTDASV